MSLADKTCEPCRGGIPPMTREDAQSLLPDVSGWTLVEEAGVLKLKRHFDFSNFTKAQDFVVKVGELAEAQGHHPDIAYGWGYAEVTFYTHKIKGLHDADFVMAAKVNRLV